MLQLCRPDVTLISVALIITRLNEIKVCWHWTRAVSHSMLQETCVVACVATNELAVISAPSACSHRAKYDWYNVVANCSTVELWRYKHFIVSCCVVF